MILHIIAVGIGITIAVAIGMYALWALWCLFWGYLLRSLEPGESRIIKLGKFRFTIFQAHMTEGQFKK